MTLSEATLEAPLRVSGFRGLDEAERARLAGMGLREGSPIVKLLRTPLRDPVECLVGPQLVAIDGWLLERILVEAG